MATALSTRPAALCARRRLLAAINSRWKWILVAAVQLLAISVSKSETSASTDDPADLSRVIVTAQAESESLTSPSTESAAQQRTEIPGGFSLRTPEAMARGRASNFEDLLQRTPGLFLQSDNGTEVTKISIRGSGILSDDEPLGVQFMLDGLTLNQADGEAILEDFDLATVRYAEVFRGANAFKYGSMTLGGAINLATMTGREADSLRIRMEGGSFGYFRGQISAGGASGPTDYVASLMGRASEGFRDHSQEKTERFFGDLGYRLNDQLENRFYLMAGRVDRELPGGLTKGEMNDNPRQASPSAVAQDFAKKWDFVRLADKISFRNNQQEFDAGLFWFHRNMEERGFFEPNFRQGITAFYSDNFGGSLNFVTHDELFGRRNIFTAGVSPQFEREVSQNFENLSGHRGQTTALGTTIAINAPLYVENQHYLTEQLSILLGMQAIYAKRHFEDDFPSDNEGDQSHEQTFSGWNPKIGMIYEIDKGNQVFANFSGSWQPPSFDNMVEFADGPNSSVVYTPLEPQRARTLEVGARGQQGRCGWELSLYHSRLRNELLELNDAQGNEIGAVNVTRSYHRGIEASLDIELLGSVFREREKDNAGDRLTLSQTYTLNDFHFDGDSVYGSNRIAGVPTHVYEADLLYATAAGFYAGPNLRCNLTRYPVDQANTLFADPSALLGFKIGFQSKRGLSVFLEARNLADKRFPSAVDPIADARTVSGAQIFHPGNGRAFYGGISWSW